MTFALASAAVTLPEVPLPSLAGQDALSAAPSRWIDSNAAASVGALFARTLRTSNHSPDPLFTWTSECSSSNTSSSSSPGGDGSNARSVCVTCATRIPGRTVDDPFSPGRRRRGRAPRRRRDERLPSVRELHRADDLFEPRAVLVASDAPSRAVGDDGAALPREHLARLDVDFDRRGFIVRRRRRRRRRRRPRGRRGDAPQHERRRGVVRRESKRRGVDDAARRERRVRRAPVVLRMKNFAHPGFGDVFRGRGRRGSWNVNRRGSWNVNRRGGFLRFFRFPRLLALVALASLLALAPRLFRRRRRLRGRGGGPFLRL